VQILCPVAEAHFRGNPPTHSEILPNPIRREMKDLQKYTPLGKTTLLGKVMRRRTRSGSQTGEPIISLALMDSEEE